MNRFGRLIDWIYIIIVVVVAVVVVVFGRGGGSVPSEFSFLPILKVCCTKFFGCLVADTKFLKQNMKSYLENEKVT